MREGVVLGILIFSPPTRVKVGKLMCQGRLGSLGRLKRFFFFLFHERAAIQRNALSKDRSRNQEPPIHNRGGPDSQEKVNKTAILKTSIFDHSPTSVRPSIQSVGTYCIRRHATSLAFRGHFQISIVYE